MAGLALVTPRTAVQGGKPRVRSGDQAQRLGCEDEVSLRGFPLVNPVLRFEASLTPEQV
jgi:hypothetical protein